MKSMKNYVKSKFCILLVLILLVGLFAACGSKTPEESSSSGSSGDPAAPSASAETANASDGIVIYVGGTLFGGTMDPVKGAMSYGYSFTNAALTRVDPASEYIGDMAESWEESADALTYTFRLRPGITFHDGSDFTAEDVVFTYETVKANQGNNENVDLSKMKSVEAPDDATVVFTLTEPYSSFLDQTALLGIVPSDGYDSTAFDTAPIGTGPWKVAQFDTDQKIIVLAFENYYEGTPAIPQVTILNMDQEAAIANAKSGALDVVMIESTYTDESVAGMHVEKLETMDVRQISLPTRKAESYTTADGQTVPFGNDVTADPAVRKALAVGIDRQTVIHNALNGVGKPAEGFTDNLIWGNTAAYPDNQKDEAKKTLEDAGWTLGADGVYEKGGLKCQFTVIAPGTDMERYQLASAVAEDARTFGIQIDVEQKPWSDVYSLAASSGVVWGWGQFDPIVLKSLFHTSDFKGGDVSNAALYSNPAVDALIDRALAASDQAEAIENWKEVQTLAYADHPYLYIVNIEHSYFVSDALDLSDATQVPHPHGHGAPVINNMKDWTLK